MGARIKELVDLQGNERAGSEICRCVLVQPDERTKVQISFGAVFGG